MFQDLTMWLVVTIDQTLSVTTQFQAVSHALASDMDKNMCLKWQLSQHLIQVSG